MTWIAAAAALLLAWVEPTAAAGGGHPLIPAVAAEIRTSVESRAVGTAAYLRRLYSAFDHEPLWHLGDGGRDRGEWLADLLPAADEHGIGGADVHHRPLPASEASPSAIAERDVQLSDAFLRYAARLRSGSVAADVRDAQWAGPADAFDPVDELAHALRSGRLTEFAASLPPPYRGYLSLVEALRRHRDIVAAGGWPTVPGGPEVKLTGDDPRLPALSARLEAEGDLTGDDVGPAALAAAVRRFQGRHGLDPDGRVGPRTLHELGITADRRVAQIAANLERWRWLPRRPDETQVRVNVAAATLTLLRNGVPAHHMRVIVGDERHPTPALAATIVAVTLNPPWTVPVSIATREMLPRLRRNPGYLAANDIVILGRPDDPHGWTVDWHAISARGFPFRLQQRPGAQNALGAIKFEMPNRFSVDLHDTPGKRLFGLTRRAFSHGCVRVERPLDLAAALLDDEVVWSAQALARTTSEAGTRRISLPRPVPVHLVYFTAFVDEGGRTNFRRDLYGRDPPIEQALGAPEPSGRGLALAGGCPGQGRSLGRVRAG